MAQAKKAKEKGTPTELKKKNSKEMMSAAFDEYQGAEVENEFDFSDEAEEDDDFLEGYLFNDAEHGEDSFLLVETSEHDFIRLFDTHQIEEESEMEFHAQMIDHTLLKPDATQDQIIKLCSEAREHHFASVCVNGYWVKLVKELLRGSGVKTCAVVGFPLGAMATEAKAFEAGLAFDDGADEVDMVINIGALKSKDYDTVARDIHAVVAESAAQHGVVKVIIETCLLTEEEKVKACLLAKLCRARFVKTSTGFSTGGATVEDVELMKSVVKDDMSIKASGGIRSLEDMEKMYEVGADRIGTSSGVKILAELAARQESETKK